MSGRAPPKAPRALLNTLGAPTSAPSSASTSASRFGTVPPTGPRSLSNLSKPKVALNGAIPTEPKPKQTAGFRPVNAPPVASSSKLPTPPPPPSSAPPPLPASTLRVSSPKLVSTLPASPPCPPTSLPPPLPPAPVSMPPPLPFVPVKPRIPPIAFTSKFKPNSVLRSPTPPEPPPPPPPPPEPASPPPRPPSPTPTPPRSPTPPKVYSLAPPLPWPSSYTKESPDFRVLFDPTVDKDRDGRFRHLAEKIRLSTPLGEPRLKGKTKGKETIYRYEGEVIEGGEQECVVRDPRKTPGTKRLQNLRPGRSEFHTIKYEFDANSTGPPPPTAILILNLSPLTPNNQIRRHFGLHGRIMAFEPQIDKQTGGALGIVFIRFSTHEEAKKCVEKENGGKNIGSGTTLGIQSVKGEELKVVFDTEEKKRLKAVLKELDDRKRRDKEEVIKKKREAEAAEKRKKEDEDKAKKEANAVQSWRDRQSADPRNRPPAPAPPPTRHPLPAHPGISPAVPLTDARPPPSLVMARMMSTVTKSTTLNARYSSRPTLALHDHSSSSTPLQHHPRGRYHERPSDRHYRPSRDHYSPSRRSSRSRSRTRSPSPVSRKPGQSSRYASRQIQRDVVLAELRKNGHDYVSIEEYGGGGQLGGNIKEDDVRKFFGGFKIDKILQDHLGWYVSFETGDSARRSSTVLNSSTRTLAHRSVTVTVHAPPSAHVHTDAVTSALTATSGKWDDEDLVEHAEKMIMKELKGLLEKDVMDRVVGVKLRQMAVEEERTRKTARVAGSGAGEERKGIKGLSFKKNKKPKPVPVPEVVIAVKEASDEEMEERVEVVQRPKKKRKVIREDIESEDTDDEDELKRKRPQVDDDIEEPVKKKLKPARVESVVLSDFDLPAVAEVRVPSDGDLSLSPQSSPEPDTDTPPPPAQESPPPDPLGPGLCEDDEDLYFAKLALARSAPSKFRLPQPTTPAPPDDADIDSPPPFRVHATGSARTEGYYKISHTEKSAYVAQYATRAAAQETVEAAETPAPAQTYVSSSRSNRANARRQAQGIVEINMVQRAMKLSLGETVTDQVKFNQLQSRKKHLRFARSPIHDWGLYALERISRGEMVIEYVGEVIRAAVADKREKAYERQGIGSSYLFRIDEDLVVDATKKGNLGRLINHCCDPNCTAKIITINGEKKIVIYAKRDIELGDEITYDYHFPIEQDKITCLCGTAKCRGYLN